MASRTFAKFYRWKVERTLFAFTPKQKEVLDVVLSYTVALGILKAVVTFIF